MPVCHESVGINYRYHWSSAIAVLGLPARYLEQPLTGNQYLTLRASYLPGL